jgi:hypothetical protein
MTPEPDCALRLNPRVQKVRQPDRPRDEARPGRRRIKRVRCAWKVGGR